jgi:hypothetical protein
VVVVCVTSLQPLVDPSPLACLQFGNLNVAKLLLGEVYGSDSKQVASQQQPSPEFEDLVFQTMVDSRDVTIHLLEATLARAGSEADVEKGELSRPKY